MGWLRNAGLADIYTRDIHGLNPLLDAMGHRGMPISADRRLEAAHQLEQERAQVMAELQALVPVVCCPTKVYKRQPTVTVPNVTVTQTAVVRTYCAYCGAARPNKRHTCWKTQEPKGVAREEQALVWIQQLPFVPSPKGLLTYFKHQGYKAPQKYNRDTGEKRDTTDEAALLCMALTHEDPVCALVLRYRGVEKLLGTYVGRPT